MVDLAQRAGQWGRQALTLAGRAREQLAEKIPALRELELDGDDLPSSGPAILAANHVGRGGARAISQLTPASVTVIDAPRRVSSADAPWADQRGSGAIERAQRVLRSSGLVLCFPEGEASPDGALHRGNAGFGALVLACQVPVIPIALLEDGRLVRVGKALDFSRFAGLVTDRVLARAVCDTVISAIVELSGQTYRDTSASSVRTELTVQARVARLQHRVNHTARRRAEKTALESRSERSRREREDLHRRAERAEELARMHAQLAAEREASRGTDPAAELPETRR